MITVTSCTDTLSCINIGIIIIIIIIISIVNRLAANVFLLSETLFHVVAGCKVYLEQGRYTWRHNSVLNFLATSLKLVEGSSLYVDIAGFPSPSNITSNVSRLHCNVVMLLVFCVMKQCF